MIEASPATSHLSEVREADLEGSFKYNVFQSLSPGQKLLFSTYLMKCCSLLFDVIVGNEMK